MKGRVGEKESLRRLLRWVLLERRWLVRFLPLRRLLCLRSVARSELLAVRASLGLPPPPVLNLTSFTVTEGPRSASSIRRRTVATLVASLYASTAQRRVIRRLLSENVMLSLRQGDERSGEGWWEVCRVLLVLMRACVGRLVVGKRRIRRGLMRRVRVVCCLRVAPVVVLGVVGLHRTLPNLQASYRSRREKERTESGEDGGGRGTTKSSDSSQRDAQAGESARLVYSIPHASTNYSGKQKQYTPSSFFPFLPR